MISSTATYALRAVVFLASQPDRFVIRSEISDATLIPHEYLLKVLNQLDAGDIVESRRGPGGGYRLRKPAKELTSLEVVLAVESIPRISECPLSLPGHEKLCPLHQLLDDTGLLPERPRAALGVAPTDRSADIADQLAELLGVAHRGR